MAETTTTLPVEGLRAPFLPALRQTLDAVACPFHPSEPEMTRPSKWSKEEVAALAEVRAQLVPEILSSPQFPEVVGDRRFLRFLRGHQMQIEVAVEKIRDMLKWRQEAGIDDIRRDIVVRGLTSPWQAPCGDGMRGIFPVMLPSKTCLDKKGLPVSVENFGFNPEEALSKFEPDDILRFHFYVMEMKAILLARWSEEQDEKRAESGEELEEGWGSMVRMFVIRDFAGFRLDALTNRRARDLIGQIITTTSNYYPELMHGCAMINTPMVFNMVWRAVKPVIAKATQEKIAIVGTRYMPELLAKVDEEMVPIFLGGERNTTSYDEQVGQTPGGWSPGEPGSLGDVPVLTMPEDGASTVRLPEEEDDRQQALAGSTAPELPPPVEAQSNLGNLLQDCRCEKVSTEENGEQSQEDDVDKTSFDEASETRAASFVRSSSRRRVHVLSPPPARPAVPEQDWGTTAEEVDKMLRKALTVVEWQLSQDWVSNELRTNCSLCRRRFTRVYRRHHCRICGEVVCGKCSPFRARVDQKPSDEDRNLAHKEALAKIRALDSIEDRDSIDAGDDRGTAKIRSATPPANYSASDSEAGVLREDKSSLAESEASDPVKKRIKAQARQKRVRICVKCYRKALAVHMSELEMVRREKGPEAVEAVWADWTKSCKYPSERRFQCVQANEAALVSQQKHDRGMDNSRMSLSAAIHSRTRSAPGSPIGGEATGKPPARPSPLSFSGSQEDQPRRVVPESKEAVAVLNATDSSYWSDGPEGRRLSPGEPHYVSPKNGSRRRSAFERKKPRSWYEWIKCNVCNLVGVSEDAGALQIVTTATRVLINDSLAAFMDNVNALGLGKNARLATGATILFLFFPSVVLSGAVTAALVRVGVKYIGVVIYFVVQEPRS